MKISARKHSHFALALTVVCTFAFSGCGQRRPTKGLLTDTSPSRPVPTDTLAETPVEELPVSPSANPSPTPSPSPKPGTVLSTTPNPRPPVHPTTGPVIKPTVFPKVPPTNPTVGPTSPTSPTVDLLHFFTRKFSQAVGTYIRGKLEKADLLPPSGEGFKRIFPSRNRGHGTLDLISLVMAASKEVHRDFPAAERVQIGDLSDKDGGTQRGHISHQNGLDADIAYFRKDHREMEPDTGSKSGGTGFGKPFVDNGKVTPNFDIETNWKFIQLLVSTKHVDRIFTDRKIKQTFCEFAVAKGMRAEWQEVLRKLRHENNHADHMHVRIKCPEKSTQCKTLAEIPAGDGCDGVLHQAPERTAEFMRMDGSLTAPAGVESIPTTVDTGDGFGC